MSLGLQFLHGIKWTGASKVYQAVSNAAIFFILARLLNPSEIGIVGMAMVFVSFLNLLLNIGFESAIIQAKKLNNSILSKIWAVNALLGAILFIGGFFLSSVIADFYSNDEVGEIFAFLSIIFCISGLSIVHRGLLLKKLKFKSIAVVEIISITFSGIIAFYLALNGYHYWSIVIQQILLALFSSVGYIYQSKWMPSFNDFNRNWDVVFAYVKYSFNVLFFNLINFITQKIDVILIGKFFGDVQLGIYILAVNIVVMPFSQLAQIFSKTVFPLFSKYSNNKAALKESYLKISVILFIIVSPFAIVFAFINAPIINFLLGEKWVLAIPLIPIFCFQIFRNSIVSPVGTIFLVTNRPDIQWKNSLFLVFPFQLLGIFIGYHFLEKTAFGIALGFNLTATLSLFPGLIIGYRLLEIGFKDFYKHYNGAIYGALILLGFCSASMLFKESLYQYMIILFGACFYLYFVFFRNGFYLERIKNLFLKRF